MEMLQQQSGLTSRSDHFRVADNSSGRSVGGNPALEMRET